ncbi:MAP4 protein, partial [Atractosteus spatula]|nr:MAP4 protein [Atractosteus spatula]
LSTFSEVTDSERGSATIPCVYDMSYVDYVKYRCTGYQFNYCNIVRKTTDPAEKTHKVSISDDKAKGVFTVTVRWLEKKDAGWYWCGIKRYSSDDSAAVYLTVADGSSILSVFSNSLRGPEGGSITVQCRYDSYYDTSMKYWCKGREWSTCKTVKVSVRDDQSHRVFTMTLNSLEKKDEDWYWCAIERTGVDYGIPLYLAVDNVMIRSGWCGLFSIGSCWQLCYSLHFWFLGCFTGGQCDSESVCRSPLSQHSKLGLQSQRGNGWQLGNGPVCTGPHWTMADLSLSDALSDSAPPAGSEALVEKDFVASLEAQSFEDEVGETVGRSDYHPLLDKDDNAPEGKSKGGAEPVLENGEQEAEKSVLLKLCVPLGFGFEGFDVFGRAQHQEVQREVLAKAEQQLIAADFLSGGTLEQTLASLSLPLHLFSQLSNHSPEKNMSLVLSLSCAFEISGLPERWGPHPVPLQPADCSPVPPVSQEALKASETTFSSSLPLTGEVATNIETTPLKMEQTWNLDDSQKPLSSPVAEPPKLQAPPSPMSQPQTPAFDTPGAAVTVAAVESPSQMEQKQGTAEPQKPPSSPGAETPKQQVPPLPISQPQTHAPEPPKLPSPAAPQEPQTTQDTHAGDPCTSPGWMGEGGLRPDLPLFTPSVSTVISRHASQAAEGSQRQSATGGGYAAALGEDRESEVAERKQQQKKKKKRRPRDEVPETFHTTTVPQGSYTESSPVAAVIPRAPPRREEGWEREEGGGRAGRGKKGKGRKRPQEDGAEREWGVPQESHVPALAHMPKVFPPSTPEGSREVEKEIPGIGSLGQVDKEPVNTLSKQLSPGVPLTDSSFPSPEKDPVLSALVPSSATATLIEPILSPPTSSLGLGDTATTLPQKDVPPTSSVDQQPPPFTKDAPLLSPKDAPVASAKEAPLLSPKDAPLLSPKDAPVPSAKDAPLLSPKDSPVPSAKDAPLLSPKDAPVASAKEAPLLSPKDAPLLSPKDAPVPSAKDAPLLSPKDSPVPSAKDAPLLSPKDAPVASAKEAPLLSPKDAPLLSPKDAPVASAKEAPLPSPKSAPVPSAKDAPLLSPKDAPLPSAKDVFAPSIEQHPAFTPTSSAPTSPAATAGPEPSSSIEMLPKDSTAPSPKDAPASSAKQLLADPTSTAKHPTSSVKRASSSRAKQQNSLENKQEKPEKQDKAEKEESAAQKAEKSDKAEKAEKPVKVEKAEKTQKVEKAGKAPATNGISAAPNKTLPPSPEKKTKPAAGVAAAPSPKPSSVKARPSSLATGGTPKRPTSSSSASPPIKKTPGTTATTPTTSTKRPTPGASRPASTTPREGKAKLPESRSPEKRPPVPKASSATPSARAPPAKNTSSTAPSKSPGAPRAPTVPRTTASATPPRRPTSIKTEVKTDAKAGEVKKPSTLKTPPGDSTRPRTTPTKSNATTPSTPGVTPAPRSRTPKTPTTASAEKKPATPRAPPKTSPAPRMPVRPATAPTHDIKNVRSKVGSTDNMKHQPGGGKGLAGQRMVSAPVSRGPQKESSQGTVQIITKKLDFSHVTSRCGSKDNIKHVPGGGNIQILNKKVDLSKVTSKCGSKANIKHKPGGGEVKIETHKVSFKEKAQSKVGSMDNVGHEPGGGNIKAEGAQEAGMGDGAPVNGALAQAPTGSVAQENGVRETVPCGGDGHRDSQGLDSHIPETNQFRLQVSNQIESHRLTFRENARARTDHGADIISRSTLGSSSTPPHRSVSLSDSLGSYSLLRSPPAPPHVTTLGQGDSGSLAGQGT